MNTLNEMIKGKILVELQEAVNPFMTVKDIHKNMVDSLTKSMKYRSKAKKTGHPATKKAAEDHDSEIDRLVDTTDEHYGPKKGMVPGVHPSISGWDLLDHANMLVHEPHRANDHPYPAIRDNAAKVSSDGVGIGKLPKHAENAVPTAPKYVPPTKKPGLFSRILNAIK